EGCEVIEEDFIACNFRIFKVDRFHFNESKVALAIFGRTDLTGDGVTGAQVELADLRGRDVDVVRAGQVVVLGRAEETETVGEAFEHALGEDEAALFRLCAEDLEDELLFAHAAGAGNVELFGDLGQVGDVAFFQLSQADADLVVLLCSFFSHMSLTSWFLSIEDFQKSDWFTGWITAPAGAQKPA